jgi:hypothetical protein
MHRTTRGTWLVVAALAALACQGDPTGDLRQGLDHLIAAPSVLFVGNGQTQNVVVTAVDAEGSEISANFRLGTIGAGLTVVQDDSFNLVYDNQGHLVQPSSPTRVRYLVTGTAAGATSEFTVAAGGKELAITVQVQP